MNSCYVVADLKVDRLCIQTKQRRELKFNVFVSQQFIIRHRNNARFKPIQYILFKFESIERQENEIPKIPSVNDVLLIISLCGSSSGVKFSKTKDKNISTHMILFDIVSLKKVVVFYDYRLFIAVSHEIPHF